MAQPQVFYALVVMIAVFAGLASAAQMVSDTPGGMAGFTKGQVNTMGSKVRGPKPVVLPEVPRMKLARTLSKDFETAVMNHYKYNWETPKIIHPKSNDTTYAALAALNQVYKSWIVPLPRTYIPRQYMTNPVLVVPKNRPIFIPGGQFCWYNDFNSRGVNNTELFSLDLLLSLAERDYNNNYPFINITINGVDVGVGLKGYPKPFTHYRPINDLLLPFPPGLDIASGEDTTCIGNGVLIENANPGIHHIKFTDGKDGTKSTLMTLVVGPYFT